MPIARNDRGQAIYVPVEVLFFDERPEDFFWGNDYEYRRRLAEARYRVLEVIRFASVPLSGRGTCHEVRGVGPRACSLADFVDGRDGQRAQRLKKQRLKEAHGLLPPNVRRLRSPQAISKRRSALFSGTDIPEGYFPAKYNCTVGPEERGRFVDLMRWYLFETAILMMYADDELVRLNDDWYVPVSVMDAHPSARRQRRRKSGKSSKRVKNDDRSFHGKPNRDRGRVPNAA